jgi:hypothetical protein
VPNCFQLARKSEPEKPIALSVIDEEMCQHFKVETDPIKYYLGWFDIIGFKLACGKSFIQIVASLAKSMSEMPQYKDDYLRLIEIALWLDENFTSNAWAEIGKR